VKNNTIFLQAENVSLVPTSHGVGQKRIFINKDASDSNLMQAALGIMMRGDEIESHLHPTMEEFYYFEEGNVSFIVDDATYNCISGSFIKVPSNTLHSLKVIENARFIYWGIAL
jgi:quercetin dioxygenase-like cupin family protein